MIVVGLVLAVLVSAPGSAGAVSFDPPTTPFGSGCCPLDVRAGDVSGDGNVDLVAGRGDSQGGAIVMLGAGDGTFANATQYFTAGFSKSVAIADIDADARPDLAVANLAGGSISALRGTGGGAFGPATQYQDAGPSSPYEIALRDLDGDGAPDIEVADNFNSSVRVRLNDGSGNFGTLSSYPVGVQPRGMAVGQIDADGELDVVTANYGGNSLSLMRGVGDGTFLPATHIPLPGAGPASVAIGDLNADGVSDLAVAAIILDRVLVFLGTGDGEFSPPVSYPVGHQPTDVAIEDLDGDGELDIASGNSTGVDSLTVLVGNGAGSFEDAQSFFAGSGVAAVTTGDFNGDGLADVATAAVPGNGVYVLLNRSDTTAPDTAIDAGPAEGTTTADNDPSFTYSGDPPADTDHFECKLDSEAFATCPASGKSYADLGESSHTFSVRAVDAVGNVDDSPATRTWTIDTTPPDTAIDTGPAEGTTADNDPTFTYSGDPPADTDHFECMLDGGSFAPCPNSGESYTDLDDGSHTFRVRAVDAAGNADQSPPSRTWTIDTAAPNTTITSGPAGPTNDPTPTFELTSSETGSSFECRVDGGAFAPCTSPHTTGALADGAYTFEVRASDEAGNTDSTPAGRSFTVDTTPPQTTITSGPSGLSLSSTARFAFASSEMGWSFECRLDGGGWQACTSHRTYRGLVLGNHSFAVRAIDRAGNVDPTPAQRTWFTLGLPI